ncbi:MAG TPA: glycosyltransferase [Steroidobacteraceae bacterium]|nr:glycosyltransferase [Steroidobacteraceae bacterium]
MVKACVIVQNHPRISMGGAQYQAHLLAEELARRAGVEVTYLARDVPPHAAQTFKLPYALRSIGTFSGIRRRAALFDAPSLWRTLHELQPDVIYQQMRQSYTAVCARYARRAGVPFFFHIASDMDLSVRGMSDRISANLPFDIAESLVGIWGLKHAGHIIAQTARQARLLRERFGRDAAVVVRNFQPLPASLPQKRATPVEVFWVANFKDVKRPELFVQLAESFIGRQDLTFTMAGRAATHRRFAPLMERIKRTPNLEYLGELPIEVVNQRMVQAAIHVNTSSFEGFPNTFIQAWAQGAVVATIAVDPDEEGMEALGIGICAGSFERLRATIDELARAPERRAAIAARAFAFVHANHSLERGAQLADLMLAAARQAGSSRRFPALPGTG